MSISGGGSPWEQCLSQQQMLTMGGKGQGFVLASLVLPGTTAASHQLTVHTGT